MEQLYQEVRLCIARFCAIADFPQPLSLNALQDMEPLQKQTLSQGVKTFVPADYALTFDIIPTGLVSDWSSIIHYTQDISEWGPKGRTPCKLFHDCHFLY